MIQICALASGSNGNCYYVGNEKEAILVDAGISTKQILLRMKSKNLDPSLIRAVFISHEHSDHIRGAKYFEKRMNVPIYMTSRTYYSLYSNFKPFYPKFFEPGDAVTIDSFKIQTFLKNHDATQPCSFRVEYNGISIGVFTDLGIACENVTTQLQQCQALFLETNYDEEMLKNGPYPFYLKKRVASQVGHLSNNQALELLKGHANKSLQHVFLSHISAQNNTPELALKTLSPLQSKYTLQSTSRHEPSEVIEIS